MIRSLLGPLAILLATGAADAKPYAGGSAGKYQRPAMAARAHFPKGYIVRARTVAASKAEGLAYVVALDRRGRTWNVEIDRATGRSTRQKLSTGYAVMDARFFHEARTGTSAQLVRAQAGDGTGHGLPTLTRSHQHLRVQVAGVPGNLLVGMQTDFVGLPWKKTADNVRFDPADGVPSARKP